MRLFDRIDISDVIRRMFVMQTNININGGPKTGDIFSNVSPRSRTQIYRSADLFGNILDKLVL